MTQDPEGLLYDVQAETMAIRTLATANKDFEYLSHVAVVDTAASVVDFDTSEFSRTAAADENLTSRAGLLHRVPYEVSQHGTEKQHVAPNTNSR